MKRGIVDHGLAVFFAKKLCGAMKKGKTRHDLWHEQRNVVVLRETVGGGRPIQGRLPLSLSDPAKALASSSSEPPALASAG